MAKPKRSDAMYYKHTLSILYFKNKSVSIGLINWVDPKTQGKKSYVRYYDLMTGLEHRRGRSQIREYAMVRRFDRELFDDILEECLERNALIGEFPKILESLGCVHLEYIQMISEHVNSYMEKTFPESTPLIEYQRDAMKRQSEAEKFFGDIDSIEWTNDETEGENAIDRYRKR